MKPLRFVLVGLGARSRVWRQVLAEHPDCRLVALVDTNRDRRSAASARIPDAVTGATLEEVTERVDADVALLCTPPGGRHAQVAAACAAGLAILAEKPLADTLADAEAHVAAAAEAGVPLAVGLNFRRFTYERWRDGRLPHLNSYPLSMAQPMLWEQSIHHFDLMRFVYGVEPVRVSARTFNPSWSMYEGDANVGALLSFTGGVEVTDQGTWAGNWGRMGFEWRTDCRRGVAVQGDMFGALGWALRDDSDLTPVPLPDEEPWLDDARGLLADFVAHFRDGTPLPCPGTDHLSSLAMVEACIRSSAGEGTVRLQEERG